MRRTILTTLAAICLIVLFGFNKIALAREGGCPTVIIVIRSCTACGGKGYAVVNACQGINGTGCDPLGSTYYCSDTCAFFDATPDICIGSKTARSINLQDRTTNWEDRLKPQSELAMQSGWYLSCADREIAALEHWLRTHSSNAN